MASTGGLASSWLHACSQLLFQLFPPGCKPVWLSDSDWCLKPFINVMKLRHWTAHMFTFKSTRNLSGRQPLYPDGMSVPNKFVLPCVFPFAESHFSHGIRVSSGLLDCCSFTFSSSIVDQCTGFERITVEENRQKNAEEMSWDMGTR